MDLQGLESFLTVAQKKSISKAAAYLHITQPTLSTRIRKLEKDLGFQLLERSWEGIKLSKQGQYFLPYVVHILHELSNASTVIKDFHDLVSKTPVQEVSKHNECLRIGINLWLAPVFTNAIITELSQHFPHLEFSFITRPTNTLKELMEYDEIHMAIYYQNEKRTRHFSQVLFKDEMVLLCSNEDWNMIGKDINNINNIMYLNKPYLLFDNPVIANNTKFINTLRSRLNIQKCRMVDHVNVMLSLVTSNKGYSVLPKTGLHQLGDLTSLPVKTVPLGNSFPSIDIHLEYDINSPLITPIKSIEKMLLTSSFETEFAS
ncbi:LysR family transcriptional regulator [Bacillus sp. V2I10]|uniref:LysR family transcriptional regulator n=1 Tax=Bacillus sp. V2I10 TaxID=3042276 RepID=UPI00278A5E32|nr:LysR family transcriptional regulator [Bacillus sp. V2I10]MDQ0862206.1 DNA-binding transcriptional LysR family regulator [Bacillus sp. V2I10]